MSGCGCASSGSCGCGSSCTCAGCPVSFPWSGACLNGPRTNVYQSSTNKLFFNAFDGNPDGWDMGNGNADGS
ncbi:hypothetical protein H9L39_13173 [Fusarium oxysporum f. sp. albedinis]|nr:hypothetical protein H9L39_13173 [Fusarium oxysporum f. sp. albedinis]